jgi:glucose-6-phosphate-specific signal transduction histidine kinase
LSAQCSSGWWTTACVRLTVTNTADRGTGRALSSEGTGHGLIGMRERAAAAGGSISSGFSPEGGFRVTATLPLLNAASPAPEGSAAPVRLPATS